jgi:hypothetical protein
MRTLMPRLAMLGVAVLALTGCNPITLLPTGGNGAGGNCVAGTWKVDTEQISSPISTPIGQLSLTTSGAGTTLTFTDTTWALHSDTTLNATLTSQFGTATGTLSLTGDANGTYTKDATQITFTLGSVSGTLAYNVNIFGAPFTGSLSLPSSGLEGLVGLHGSANYTCDSSALTFSLPPITAHAHH